MPQKDELIKALRMKMAQNPTSPSGAVNLVKNAKSKPNPETANEMEIMKENLRLRKELAYEISFYSKDFP